MSETGFYGDDVAIERQRSILRFRVANCALAVPAECVEVIVEPSAITPIPCAPAHVPGLIALRGEAVPVFDVGAFFGIDAEGADPDRTPRVLIVRSTRYRVGILCDVVLGVARVQDAQIDEPRASQPSSLRRHAIGELFLDGAVTPLLDVDALLEAGRAR